jgi:predicted nucleotidyltransferase
MIVPDERMRRAVEALKEFGARRVLLFGSFLTDPENANDVDLAVEGIPLNRIIDASVALHDILEVQADLVSREENPKFFDFVARYGRFLYEES